MNFKNFRLRANFMHQTFYIDIDEEITSIVDRLRKSMAGEVVIVVPKRAILIQSIVNLKLLKKEADNLGKKLILVTQDKFGKMLIEKIGIPVEQKLDDIKGQEIIDDGAYEESRLVPKAAILDAEDARMKKRFNEMGSDEYYQAESSADVLAREIRLEDKNIEDKEEQILNKELVIDMGDDLKKQIRKNASKKGGPVPMDMFRNVEISEETTLESSKEDVLPKSRSKKDDGKLFKQEKIHESYGKDERDEERNRKAESFLKHRKNSDEYKSVNVGSSAWKYFLAFGFLFILIASGMAAYLYLPKVSVVVFPKNKIQSVDAQIEARTDISDIDGGKELMPAKIISVSHELTRSYDVTGTKNSSDKKAHGTITIYNEFSTSPQPLVATTRFEAPDGKIFRLVSGVTVPGMEKVGTETKPGAIEAKVIADEPGGSYNIAETSFTIPGFKSSGNDKYAKIYAKSFKSMTGGGEDTEEIKTLSEADIDSAKVKVSQELAVLMKQKLKEEAGSEYIVLDEAINADDSVYTLSNSSGDAVSNFSITVRTTANAMAFKDADIRKVLARSIAKKGAENMRVAENSINMDFGKPDVDFGAGSIIIRVHATGGIVPNIDIEGIKKGILGKNEDEVKNFVDGYSDISNIEISYWPAFISGKIPSYESRVDISLDPGLVLP